MVDRANPAIGTKTDRDARERRPPLNEPPAGGPAPTQFTNFIGRQSELAEVRRLVVDNRLVTLVGPGGLGKTRLAAELAGELVGDFPGGVWWVDLAPITDPGSVPVRVARTLNQPDIDTLTRFAADQPRLLVLDNCEHLLDACSRLAGALLTAGTRLTLLTTSQEPLGVAGERAWRMPSLSPADEAVELFTDRARLARADFAVTTDTATAVAEICRRLDGIPLAIELAAARVGTLPLTEIAAGLHHRFRVLTGGARAAAPRPQTLRAAMDWAHALLSEPARVLFRRLAVFSGGFDPAAAQAVAGPVDELPLLVDRSLVIADRGSPVTRYRLLETVRQYALEKLGASGEVGDVRARHRDHYTALFEGPLSDDLQRRTDRATTEIDNLRTALAWSLDEADVRLAARLA